MKRLIAVAALSLAACATNSARKASLEEIPAQPAAPSEPAPVVAEAPETAPTEPLPCALTPVHFDFDSTLLADDARNVLGDAASCIAQKKIGAIVIEGHADERGTEAYNIALGQRRADAVRGYLKKLGVGAKIDVVSFGEAFPVDSATTEKAWHENRRAELKAPGEPLSDGRKAVPGA